VDLRISDATVVGVTTTLAGGLALLGRHETPPEVVERAGLPPLLAAVGLLVVGGAVLVAGRRLGDLAFVAAGVGAQLMVLIVVASVQRLGIARPTPRSCTDAQPGDRLGPGRTGRARSPIR
jgi:hypothetical protein